MGRGLPSTVTSTGPSTCERGGMPQLRVELSLVLPRRRQRDAADAADAAHGPLLDGRVPGNRRMCLGPRVDPDIVTAAVMAEKASVGAQVTFERASIH